MSLAKFKPILRNIRRPSPAYFTIGGWQTNLRYFLKMGHLPAHIMDRVKFKIFPKFYIIPKFPTHLDIETSSACQMKCSMCYTTHMSNDKKGIMGLGLYKRLIEQAKEQNVYSIKLSWRGEPLLNKNIIYMVKYAIAKGIKEVALLTNGELLNEKMSMGLVDAGLNWISISADGVGDVYNKIRSPAIFEDTVKKVAFLKEYRDKKGFRKPLIRVQSLMSAVKDNPQKFYSTWKELTDRMNMIADQARDFEKKDMQHDPEYFCPKPWQRMSITHEGKVYQCNSDYNGLGVMGDANTDKLIDIWHGDAFNRVREAFKNHTYLKDNKPCLFCTEGVVTKEDEINVGARVMKVRGYKLINNVSDESGITFKDTISDNSWNEDD